MTFCCNDQNKKLMFWKCSYAIHLMQCVYAMHLFTTENTESIPKNWRSRSVYQILTDRFANLKHTACLDLNKYCGGTFKVPSRA